jgi:hypothetical protein
MKTPPIEGATTLRSSESFISSCPTMAVKGKTWRSAGGSVPRVSGLRRAVIKVLVLAGRTSGKRDGL